MEEAGQALVDVAHWLGFTEARMGPLLFGHYRYLEALEAEGPSIFERRTY